jgi:hypothetical protein
MKRENWILWFVGFVLAVYAIIKSLLDIPGF